MNNRQRKTFNKILETPTRPDVTWTEVGSFLKSIGVALKEGKGSRVSARLGEFYVSFHKPHPQKELKKGAVEELRKFLIAGNMRGDK